VGFLQLGFLHNGILIAVLAHGLIGASLLWDKVLLRRPATQNLFSYVFWMGAMSIFGLILMFFGFHMPRLPIALLAFGSGALDLVATFFYYQALKRGEASEALAVMGGFAPVATALFAAILLATAVSREQLLAFALMVGGGFLMFFAERMSYRQMLAPVLLASGVFGLVNVTQKIAFNDSRNFVSAYVLFTLGTFTAAMALLIPPSCRRQIFENSGQAEPRSRTLYFVNRFVNGLGAFLVYYAISLTNPAMVAAIDALRYVIVFVGAFLITVARPQWLREQFHGMTLLFKTVATALVVVGLVLASLRARTVTTTAVPRRTLPDRRPAIVASGCLPSKCIWPARSRIDSWRTSPEWRS
jgi:drug/metabolite transporter (DMT)-like permease